MDSRLLPFFRLKVKPLFLLVYETSGLEVDMSSSEGFSSLNFIAEVKFGLLKMNLLLLAFNLGKF